MGKLDGKVAISFMNFFLYLTILNKKIFPLGEDDGIQKRHRKMIEVHNEKQG